MAITVTRDKTYPRIKGGTRRHDVTITLDDDYPGTEGGYELTPADLGMNSRVHQVWIQPIIDAAAWYLARYDIDNELLVILSGAADAGDDIAVPAPLVFNKEPADVGNSETGTVLMRVRSPRAGVVKSIAVYCATHAANVAIDCKIGATSCLDATFTPVAESWATGTIDTNADDVEAGDAITVLATSDGTGATTGIVVVLEIEMSTTVTQGGTGVAFAPVADASSDLDGLEVKMHVWGR